MKILQIIPSFGMGGAEVMCEKLCISLMERGHEVIPVSLFSIETPITQRLEQAGFSIQYLEKKAGFDFRMYPRLVKLFSAHKPDIIHTHMGGASLYAFPAASLCRIRKVVHTIHAIANREHTCYSRILQRYYFKKWSYMPIALSALIQKTIVDEYDIPAEDIPVVMNGTDLSTCIPKTNYSGSSPFRVLHVGRFASVKNHIGLIDAFKIFHVRYPNSVLTLVGDGELRKEVEQQIARHHLETCVEILGAQDNVFPILSKADIFALPSHHEGVPISLIEAMGTGLPIVATRVGGIPNMVEHQESALLTEADAVSISAAFEELYLSEALREKLGTNAKKHSLEFSAATMAQQYEQMYQKLLLRHD